MLSFRNLIAVLLNSQLIDRTTQIFKFRLYVGKSWGIFLLIIAVILHNQNNILKRNQNLSLQNCKSSCFEIFFVLFIPKCSCYLNRFSTWAALCTNFPPWILIKNGKGCHCFSVVKYWKYLSRSSFIAPFLILGGKS